MITHRRKFITKTSLYDMSSFHFRPPTVRINLKSFRLASRVRTRIIPKMFYDVHRTPLTKLHDGAKFYPIYAKIRVQDPKIENFNKILLNFGILTPRRSVSLAPFLRYFQLLYCVLGGLALPTVIFVSLTLH